MAFSPEQQETAQDLKEAPSFGKAGPLAKQALIEGGIVESGLRDAPPSEGNLDSQGVLQQRASQGWGTVAQERNPTLAAEMFLQHAIPLERQYRDAGSLAQAVQRSAFPGRYGEHAQEAQQLLGNAGSGALGGLSRALGGRGSQPGVQGIATAQLADLAALLDAASGAGGSSTSVEGLSLPKPTSEPQTGPRIPREVPQTEAPSIQSLLSVIDQIGEHGEPLQVQPSSQGGPAEANAAQASRLGGALKGILPEGAKLVVNRTDKGKDILTNPGGALLAPGRGEVVAVPSDPSGFGPAYPVIRWTSGPLAGHTTYFGHTDSAVRQGEQVHEGQVIAHTSRTGHNAPPGWAEIGLWGPGGPAAGGGDSPSSAGAQIARLLGVG